MPRPSSARLVLGLLAIAVLMGSAAWLQRVRDQRFPRAAQAGPSLYVTSGSAVRRISAGYTTLAADLYWIRAMQYYGGAKLSLVGAREGGAGGAARSEYTLLYPMLDLTTTLDPRFNIAYRFGAIFLAEPYPGGAGRPDLAVALLEKGLREQPDKWEYMQDIGFVHYWWRHDYGAASSWFDRASRVTGAPWWLRSLAATTLAEGGDRQSSRLMWEAIRESAEIDWLRRDAERRLLQLRALDEMDEYQKRIDNFTRRSGVPPPDWITLVRAGVFPGMMADPTRTPYEIDGSGRIRLSMRSSLFPIPVEPQRIGPAAPDASVNPPQ